MTDDGASTVGRLSPSEPVLAFVPLHTDNWALALASGYMGGALKADQARDVQAGRGDDVVSFTNGVPAWSLTAGENGPRVVLVVEGLQDADRSHARLMPGPIRVTSARQACFESQAALDNFVASYGAFPDVPLDLIPNRIGGYEVIDALEPSNADRGAVTGVSSRRLELDFFAGWSAAILSLLEAGDHDEELTRFLAEDVGGSLGARSLRAFDREAGELDLAIWTATVDGLRSRFGRKGFDRRDFLSTVADRIRSFGDEATSWVNGCRRVIDAELDIPILDDSAHLGRRAALAVILAHEASGVTELESVLGVGAKVRALVMQAVYAFSGLARLEAHMKAPVGRLDAVLSLAERLAGGGTIDFETRALRIGGDLSRVEQVLIAGVPAFERSVQAPPYILMLKARAQEAGYQVKIDQDEGRLVILARRPKSPSIAVEANTSSLPGQPVVNLVLPLATLGARPTTASLKAYLALAWEHATTIGLRNVGGTETICAVASIPLATLDRDEFGFHVERLLAIWQTSTAGKRRARAEPRRP